MALPRVLLAALFLVGLVAVPPALASSQRFEYRVEHPSHGNIGTYINRVERNGDRTTVESELHIAVKVLGVVVYRQEGRRIEHWQGERFVGFEGVTITNGERLEVRGEARANGFVITTPAGTTVAPLGVHPSNPWSPAVLNADYMMSTRTGQVTAVQVIAGAKAPAAFSAGSANLHQYEIIDDKRQFVWFDDRGTPIAFRTEERGTPIDFVLTR